MIARNCCLWLGFGICPHRLSAGIVVTSSTIAVCLPQMAHAGSQGQAYMTGSDCLAGLSKMGGRYLAVAVYFMCFNMK